MKFILRHRTSAVAVVLAILTIAWAAYAQDRSFWTDAAQIGTAEVALGTLGSQKAQNEKVKQFAEQVVKDHSTVNDELKSIASGKSVSLPTDVSTKQKAAYDKLNGLSGADFDREFIKVMVKDHQSAVKLFEKQSRNETDADAKAFAAKHLPTLQGHLQTAQSISSELKQSSKDAKMMNGSEKSTNSNSNNK